jgi:hypothetical protein
MKRIPWVVLLVLVASSPAMAQPAQTKAIQEKLNRVVSLDFENAPLEEVIAYIKKETKDPNNPRDRGIPIYIDPQGLRAAGATMQSPITIKMDGAPLKTTLPLILKQHNLGYIVRNGLLTITSLPRRR